MSLLAAALLTLSAAPADSATTNAITPPADPDPMVCRTEDEIGSRLKKKRVCMRKSEWAAQREENRQMINRSQVQLGTKGS